MSSLQSLLPVLLVILAVALPVASDPPDSPGKEGTRGETSDPGVETGPTSTDPEIQRLQRDLASILASTGNRRGEWAILAVSLDRHDTLLTMNPDRVMVPASNMKLLTTAAALHYLGPDFRYRSFILADGIRSGSTLEGDLIFYGTGDPTLSERYYPTETSALDSLAGRIAAQGITSVHGNLVVDGSYFSGSDLHPDWKSEDLNDAFAAPVAAVGLAENVVTVRVEPGAWVGARPSIFTIPGQAGIPVRNLALTRPAGSPSRIWLLRETPQDPIGIEGEMPLNGAHVWRRLPVGDPLHFTGTQFLQALERNGISVSGRLLIVRDARSSPVWRGVRPTPVSETSETPGADGARTPPRVLATLRSPPLREILRVINKESHNFFAETILKTLGRTVRGDGSYQGGAEAVEEFLVSAVGLDRSQVRVRDGSGLSTENRATPGVFVRTLEHMSGTDQWETLLETLPEAGIRRELRRMYNSPAARNLRAKTGTMDSVSALSGVVRTQAGERVLFSILANQVPSEYRAKRAEDQIGIRLAALTRAPPD